MQSNVSKAFVSVLSCCCYCLSSFFQASVFHSPFFGGCCFASGFCFLIFSLFLLLLNLASPLGSFLHRIWSLLDWSSSLLATVFRQQEQQCVSVFIYWLTAIQFSSVQLNFTQTSKIGGSR